MKPFSRTHALTLAGATLLAGVMPLAAMDLDGLVKNSPFGQSNTGALGGRDTKPGVLEFRGLYVDAGVTYFSIYNNQTKQSSWVAQGKAPSGPVAVSVKDYDPINEVLVIENAGQPVKLPLRQVTVGKIDAPQPMIAAGGFNQAAPQAAPAASNISDEKLQAFRDEMRKRFAERQQNGGGNTGDTNGGNFGGRGSRNRGGDNAGGGNNRGNNAGNNNGAPN
jgi:hypothetical protein